VEGAVKWKHALLGMGRSPESICLCEVQALGRQIGNASRI